MAGTRTKRRWALDADLKAAFDRVDHDHILGQLGTFPAREQVAGWLKAGVIDKDGFAPTEEGTPQGGVISPLIFDIALHGMEEAAGTVYRWNPYRQAESTVSGTPVLVRYADDFVALCDSREAGVGNRFRRRAPGRQVSVSQGDDGLRQASDSGSKPSLVKSHSRILHLSRHFTFSAGHGAITICGTPP